MSRIVNVDKLNKLAEALDERHQTLVENEQERASAAENNLSNQIENAIKMFDGKSFKYVTQEEYDNLSNEEKNDPTITYFITDSVDLSHEHENKEFLDSLHAKKLVIGNCEKSLNGDLNYSISDIGAAPEVHNHDYNDLENKPFYGNRNLERIELTFDGNLEGKETIGDTEVFVKITDIVYKEDLDEMINGAMSYWIADTGDVDVTNLAQRGAQIDVLVEEKLYLVAEFIVVALDDVEYSALGQYPFTKGIWFIYIEDFLQIKSLSFDRVMSTISNQSNTYTLDSKGNAWFAGDVSIGENNKRLATEEYVDNNKGVTDYNDLENKPCYETIGEKNIILTYENCTETIEGPGANYSLKKACIDINQYTIDELLDCLVSCRLINAVGGEYILNKEEIREATIPVNEDLYMLCEEFGIICFKETEEFKIPVGLWFAYRPECSVEFDFVDKNAVTIKQLDEKFIPDTIVRMEDMPCYDNRVYVDEVLEYDGVADGKAIGAVPALGCSSLIKVADLTTDQYNNYLEALNNGYKLTIADGDGNITTREDIGYGTFIDGAVYIEGAVLAPQVFSMSIGHATNYVSEPGIYFENSSNSTTLKLEIRITKGGFKIIEGKYLTNSPGVKMEEGKEVILGDITYTVGLNAEIFNDYENNIAAGRYSHAEGLRSKALADCSHAEGSNVTATGVYSHVEGIGSKAIGDAAHAEGWSSIATGDSSHAEGQSTDAIGDSSHAEGESTEARGAMSHAEGYKTIAAGDYQHVQGRNNIVDEENKYAHIVGNGGLSYGDSPSNAHTLDWNGNAWFAGDVSIGENNKRLATEEYVDNNKGVTDYNDLENKPFYNNRNLERIDLTFDGNFEGKETLGQVNMTFVKVTDEVYEEDMKEIEENGILTVWTQSTGDVSSEVSQESYFFEEIEENVYMLSEAIVVALDDVEYSESGRYPFTKGIWFGNISNYFILKGLSFNRNTTAISNQSNTYTLDSKGNAWFAGKLSQEATPTEAKDLTTKAYVDEKLSSVDATTINGYSIWIGTSEELKDVEEKDPKTLYFEIDNNQYTEDEVVPIHVVDGKLNLIDHKYQKCLNIVDGVEIVFPEVNGFTELHLYFDASTNINLNFPDNCKWRVESNIENGSTYEMIATYNTMYWLVNILVYS